MTAGSDHWIEQARAYLTFQVDMGLDEVILPLFVPEELAEPPAVPEKQAGPLDAIRQELGECRRCPLSNGRKNLVFGEGNPTASLMFVGEGPGADEDRAGRPFVGRAGQLLDKMIKAMGLARSDVYIANVVKCRPPDNRDPQAAEIETCFPFLEAQIGAVEPRVIVALGRIAAWTLLSTRQALSALRGRFHDRKGVPVMPTYHPSFLLRQEPDRRFKGEAWSDLKQVMAALGTAVEKPGEKL